MLNQNKLSIIIPVYNVEKYLNRCVESVVGQTYSNIEIILVDDGSTDSSGKICDTWELRDKRIKTIHKTNGGLSSARNVGIDKADGRYIAFVDSDDYIESDMYEAMIKAILETRSQVATCGRIICDINGNYINEKHALKKVKIFDSIAAIHEILVGGCIEEAAWDKVYEKSLFDDVRFPIGENNEDIVVMPSILMAAKRIVHVGKAYYHYRKNNNGITKSKYNDSKNILFSHMDYIEKYIDEKVPKLVDDILIFRGRYAYSTLKGMVINKETIINFSSEIKSYKGMLRKAAPKMLISSNFTLKDKFFILLLLCDLYGPLWRLFHEL